jgi:hypothetical protein
MRPAFLLVAALILPRIASAQTSACAVSGDGAASVVDVQFIINEALGSAAPSNDLNGDGAVNVVDVQIVINGVLGLSCSALVSLTAITPHVGSAGQNLTVVITGLNTAFTQGQTQANFGAGISVGGAAEGASGPVIVNSPRSLTAQIVIDPSAVAGVRAVTVTTGVQQESLAAGFVLITQQPATTGTNGTVLFPNVEIQVVDSASQQPLANVVVTLLNDGVSQGVIVTDPSGTYAPAISLVGSGMTLGSSQATQIAVEPSDAPGGRGRIASQGVLQVAMSTLTSLGALGPFGFAQVDATLTSAMWQSLVNQCEAACSQGTSLCQKNVPLSSLRTEVLNSIGAGGVQGLTQSGYFYVLENTLPQSAAAFKEVDTAFGAVTAAPGAVSNTLTVLEEIEGIYYQQEGYQWTSLFNSCEEIPPSLNVPLVGLGSFLVMYPLESPNGTISTTINGAVVNSATGSGIAGATVYVAPGGIGGFNVQTGTDGTFSGPVQGAPGEYTLVAEASGYVTGYSQFIILENNQPESLSISLAPYTPTQPFIQSVSPILAQANQGIVITGSGFGNTPPQTVTLNDRSVDTVACNVTTPALAIWDKASSAGGNWEAGQETCASLNAIGVKLASWSDSQIVLNGFGSALGNAMNPSTWNITSGDPLTIIVSGTNNSGTAAYNLQVAPTSPISPSGAVIVTVPGDQAWTDTGIYLNVGDTVTISASGSVTMTTDGHIPPMSPAGFPPNCTAGEVYGQYSVPFPAAQLPCWSLVGEIGTGGPIFEIGTNTIFQAQMAGEFYLGVNDNYLGDNSGSWVAAITRNSSGAASGGTTTVVTQATISDFASSLELPTANMYLYGMVTGGAYPSSTFAAGPYAQAVDADGNLSAALAYGSTSQNSYTTSAGYYDIVGVAVSGSWASFNAYYGSNTNSGASGTSVSFTVSTTSLVVFLGLASSQQSISIGGIPGLQIDALESGSSAYLGVVAAHAVLTPGNTYTVTVQSAALAAGQDPNHMVDLLGVFVFGGSN